MALHTHGMPHGSFRPIFEGPPGIQQQFWDALKKSASLREAAIVLCQPYRFNYDPTLYDRHYLRPPPLYISEQSPIAIREMTEGISNISLESYNGTV